MITRFLHYAFLLLCFSSSVLAQPSETEIDSLIDVQFSRYNESTPGYAIGVLKGGQMVFQKGYGSADLEQGVIIDPHQSVFNLASVSKQFTVFAILLLEEEGRLSLEDDIHQYLPDLPNYGMRVSLRHLASNTSGIRSDLEMMGMAGYSNDDLITRGMVRAMIFRQQELNFVPGEEFLYSNSNFVLLAEVVEKVSGMSFAAFLEQRIFEPLGMTSTFVMDDYHRLIPHRAYAYSFWDGAYRNDFIQTDVVGSTGVYTTLGDFARWALDAQDTNGSNAAVFQRMNTPLVLSDGSISPYGLGVFITEYKGFRQIHHAGGTGSYRSIISIFPEQDLVVLLLSNDGNGDVVGEMNKIVDVYLEAGFYTTPPVETPAFPEAIPKRPLATLIGSYFEERDYYVRSIACRNDSLFYVRPEQNDRASYLRPLGNNHYAIQETSPTFYVDFKQNSMEVYSDDHDKSQLSVITPYSYSLAELKLMEGRYFSEELNTTYSLRLVDGVLQVEHPRMSPFMLRPVKVDGFLSDSWRFSYLEFERNFSGSIQGFRVSSSRVRRILFKRL